MVNDAVFILELGLLAFFFVMMVGGVVILGAIVRYRSAFLGGVFDGLSELDPWMYGVIFFWLGFVTYWRIFTY